MPAPQNILDALDKLHADSEELTKNKTDADEKDNFSAQAAHEAGLAHNAVNSGATKLVADRDAAVKLIIDTYPAPTP